MEKEYCYRYMVRHPKKASRPTLVLSHDGGSTYEKVAVFSNEEQAEYFGDWLKGILEEYAKNTGGKK